MRLSVPAALIGTLGSIAQRAIGGVNALVCTLWGYTYGANYKSTTNMASNTSEQVFAPGSNTNGAMLWRASGRSQNATSAAGLGLIAHTAAPNSAIVGDVLAVETTLGGAGGGWFTAIQLEEPVFIAAGKGLWWNAVVAETSAYRQCSYTLF